MSGPKVVRVITKQEIIATCQSRLHALEDAIIQWRKCAYSCEVLADEKDKAVEKRFFFLLLYLENEQFSEMQNQCTTEISALKTDIARMKNEAIVKAELERSMCRRLQYSAETLIKNFEANQLPIPAELSHIATFSITANKIELAQMNSMLSKILTEHTLHLSQPESITDLQKKLSTKLSVGEKIQSLTEWKIDQNLNIKTIESDRRLDHLLSQMESTKDESIKPFLTRVALIAQEPASSHRTLLTDSLILDLVAHLDERKVTEQAMDSMREIRNQLRSFTSQSAKDLTVLLTKSIDSNNISLSKPLRDKGIALLQEETKAMAAVSRREAVLKGLAALGYEVKENMVTAWAENGRIVVRKPNEKSYGVELGAVADAERMQVQLVSFEDAHDARKAARDLDRETTWCSEFSHLKSLLEKSGTALHIDKALPVGSKPPKKVQEADVVTKRAKKL